MNIHPFVAIALAMTAIIIVVAGTEMSGYGLYSFKIAFKFVSLLRAVRQSCPALAQGTACKPELSANSS